PITCSRLPALPTLRLHVSERADRIRRDRADLLQSGQGADPGLHYGAVRLMPELAASCSVAIMRTELPPRTRSSCRRSTSSCSVAWLSLSHGRLARVFADPMVASPYHRYARI